MFNYNFYKGKWVFLTGHTGFKGSWMCRVLLSMGAEVTGYSLQPPTVPSLFNLLDLQSQMKSIVGDMRDLTALKRALDETQPEIVIHLAAQPIVRDSYTNPHYTYETNVMGTVNLLECIRISGVPPKSVVNITTDKVYLNREWGKRQNRQSSICGKLAVFGKGT